MTNKVANPFSAVYDEASKKYGITGIDARNHSFIIYVNDEETQETLLKELIIDYENNRIQEEFVDGTILLEIAISSDNDYGFDGMIGDDYSKSMVLPETDVSKGVALLDRIKNTLYGRNYCCVRVAYVLDYVRQALLGIQNNEFDYADAYCSGNDEVEVTVFRNKPKTGIHFKTAPELPWGDDYEQYHEAYFLEHPDEFIRKSY